MEGESPVEKIPAEKLVGLCEKIESLKPVDLNDAVNQLKMSTEHVLHEQVTGDDAPHKYAQILSDLQTLNQELAKIRALPERIDL